MLRFRNTFSKNTMFKFYKTFILPHFFIIVQYGIQLWYTQQWKTESTLISAFLDLF